MVADGVDAAAAASLSLGRPGAGAAAPAPKAAAALLRSAAEAALAAAAAGAALAPVWASEEEGASTRATWERIRPSSARAAAAGGGAAFGAGASGGAAKIGGRGRRKKVQLIDTRRANNVGVGLAQFRSFAGDFDALCEAVIRQDAAAVPPERLVTLGDMLPTKAELSLVRGHGGDEAELAPPERFFLAVGRRGEAFPRKLECFAAACAFPEASRAAERGLSCLIGACGGVIGSGALSRLLQRLLAVGNLLNEGTYRGNAAGVALGSLLRVTTTKGADRKTTVLDFVVADALGGGPGGPGEGGGGGGGAAMLEFRKEVGDLPAAARLSLGELAGEVRRLRARLSGAEAMVAEMGREERLEAHDLQFLAKTSGFCRTASVEVERLEELLRRAEERAASLMEYFAEEPDPRKVGGVFATLDRFAACVEASRAKTERQIEARRREQRRRERALKR